MPRFLLVLPAPLVLAGTLTALLALVVPTDVQLPGTQPLEVQNIRRPAQCKSCHGDYDVAVEPYRVWEGSLMAQATRDPLFWACMAIAEQDFDGAGDLCTRCHAPDGWLDGRSTPTDGSALQDGDAHGVSCHFCHLLTNPDGSEHFGVQNPPFVANDGGAPAEGWYGSGMYVLSPDVDRRLGPYANTVANHAFAQSEFHRDSALCGTCHDVSNPVTGDLAHNNGAPVPLAPGSFSGQLGAPLTDKAAFRNAPFLYGVMERTFSEHVASDLSTLLVSDYPTLPTELQEGILEDVYLASLAAGQGGDYEDGTDRYFTCQSCHVRPVVGKGSNKNNSPLRYDLPLHDMTGGNTWAGDAIAWLDGQGLLSPGGGLGGQTLAALDAAELRAREMLEHAAELELSGNTLKVINLTGHKLPTGYPEGRRMWLHVSWYDGSDVLLREDGAYGPMTVTVQGQPYQVDSILDLGDPQLRIYEAPMAMTKEWADQLLGLGYPAGLVLDYDRVSGQPGLTLGGLAAQPAGTYAKTFHFVLNNTFAGDNRIPPYGYDYDVAKLRNALPLPETLYGDPGPGGKYDYWDEVALSPPAGAARGEIELLYQPTSWEYVQFLLLANDGSVPFLADRGQQLFDAWRNTGMASPEVMYSETWTNGVVQTPTLAAANMTAGATATLTVTNATPNGRVDYAYALAGGGPASLPAGPCGTLTVALTPPVTVIGFVYADPGGTAALPAAIPAIAGGVTVWMQALDQASCTLTNGIAEVVN